MEKDLFVISTLVFADLIKDGMKQSDILEIIHDMGITNVEIRREFIKDFDKELATIRKKAEKLQMGIYYAVPERLYANRELQFKKIETYFKEAYLLGCSRVKMIVGPYGTVKPIDVIKMNELCEKYFIRLTVENDQTREDGRVEKLKRFVEEYRQEGGKISVTFDIGNWVWQGEDPAENASKIKNFVSYVQLKDVKGKINPKTVLLNEGDIDWKNIFPLLPRNLPVALEYSCGSNPAKQLREEITKMKDL